MSDFIGNTYFSIMLYNGPDSVLLPFINPFFDGFNSVIINVVANFILLDHIHITRADSQCD